MRDYIYNLFIDCVIHTPDGKLIREKENRYNDWYFSYSRDGKTVHTLPRNIQFDVSGKWGGDIKQYMEKAILKKNAPIRNIEFFNASYGYEFNIEKEVGVWIDDRPLWEECLYDIGLTRDHDSIMYFYEKYKDKNKQIFTPNYFADIPDKRYLRFDIYDSVRHLNIEHDGSWCHIPEIDSARDNYLLTKYPTLFIERIEDYDETKPECVRELKKIFDTYYTPLYKNPLIFTYDDEVIKQQIEKNKKELDYIIQQLEMGNKLENINSKLASKLSKYEKRNYGGLKNLICA